jgi:hypothetical protein
MGQWVHNGNTANDGRQHLEHNMSVYQEQGYESRRDYLESLADEFGIDPIVVFTLASMLGPSEDFDGLVTSLEDEYA